MSYVYETVIVVETRTADDGEGIDAIDIDSRSSLRGITIPLAEWRTIVEEYAKAFAEPSEWYANAWPERDKGAKA